MRYRWCINPVPDNGGDYCVGDGNETMRCNEIPCDGKFLSFESNAVIGIVIDFASDLAEMSSIAFLTEFYNPVFLYHFLQDGMVFEHVLYHSHFPRFFRILSRQLLYQL